MPNKKISQLTGVTTPSPSDEYAINQGGVTYKITSAQIKSARELTYAQFRTEQSNATLNVGEFIRITDYATKYDQPDYDAAGVLKGTVPLKTATVEPLICLVTATNGISPYVYSATYPSDIIKWDWSDDETYLSLTSRTGRITYREDEYGNAADFDWKATYFLRRETSPGSGVFTVIKDNGGATDEFLMFAEYGNGLNCVNNKVITRYGNEFTAGIDLPNTVFFASTRVANCDIKGVCVNVNLLAADDGGDFYTDNVISTGTMFFFNGGEDLALSKLTNHGTIANAVIKQCNDLHISGTISGGAGTVTIDIAEQVDVTGEIDGSCTIGQLSFTDITGQIVDSAIVSADNTGLYGKIENTQMGAISNAEIADTINNSILGDLTWVDMTGIVADSNFQNLVNCQVFGDVNNITFDDDLYYTQIVGKIDYGAPKTIDVATYPQLYTARGAKRLIEQANNAVYIEYLVAGVQTYTNVV